MQIKIQLDQPRYLTMDFEAITALEDHMGISLPQQGFVPKSVEDLRLFFWCCLQTDAKERGLPITLEEVGRHLCIEHFKEALQISLRLLGGTDQDKAVLAPYVPTEPEVFRLGFKLAAVRPEEKFWDLGCGDGRSLLLAHKAGMIPHGVEMDANRARVATAVLAQSKITGTVLHAKIQDTVDQWSKADVVFVYLLGASNSTLAPELEKLRAGARIISHDFLIEGWEPSKVGTIKAGNRSHTVYVYEIGKHKKITIDPESTEISEQTAEEIAAALTEQLEAESESGPEAEQAA